LLTWRHWSTSRARSSTALLSGYECNGGFYSLIDESDIYSFYFLSLFLTPRFRMPRRMWRPRRRN
jgi:hypothetical protein